MPEEKLETPDAVPVHSEVAETKHEIQEP